jgi:hypothetical protein
MYNPRKQISSRIHSPLHTHMSIWLVQVDRS